MATYTIFADRSATIYAATPEENTGRDQILDIGVKQNEIPNSLFGGGLAVSRALLGFDINQINEAIAETSGSVYNADVVLFLANAEGAVAESVFEIFPVFESWEEGLGIYNDNPQNRTGVSWTYRDFPSNTIWGSGSLPFGVEFSSGSLPRGGGNWYAAYSQSNTLDLSGDFDLRFNVTDSITALLNSAINDNGFIIKLSEDDEFSAGRDQIYQYYSVNTQTIYPPRIELSWDDSVFTGSLPIIEDTAVFNVNNNYGEYANFGKARFRMSVRPQYPTRSFSTTSNYITQYRFPEGSMFGIQDVITDEMIVDFSEFTKISSDEKSSYFDIYMSGLYPERHYRILVKTNIDGNEVVIDSKDRFKVVRHGQ